MKKTKIVYVTSSDFKVKENEIFAETVSLDGGGIVGDVFDFEIRKLNIKEVLEINLEAMVMAEVVNKTYAEIVEDPALGLAYKIRHLSQSSKAMKKFLHFRQSHAPELWSSY